MHFLNPEIFTVSQLLNPSPPYLGPRSSTS